MIATESPRLFSRRPIDATAIPLPTDDATPPVTNKYFAMCYSPDNAYHIHACYRFVTLVTRQRGGARTLASALAPLVHCYPRYPRSNICVSAGKVALVITALGSGSVNSTPISWQNLSSGSSSAAPG